MKRTFTWLVAVVIGLALLVGGLPGCGAAPTPPPAKPTPPPAAPAPAPTPAPAPPAYKWPSDIVFGGHEVGTGTYAEFTGVAPVLEKTTGMKVRITPAGDPARFKLLIDKQVPMLAMAQVEVNSFYRGAGVYVELPKVMISDIWYMQSAFFNFWTTKETGIKTIYDIKKKVEAGEKIRLPRIPSIPARDVNYTKMLPAMLGVDSTKFEYVPLATAPLEIMSPAEGKTDISWISSASPQARETLAGPRGGVVLETPWRTDPKLVEGILQYRPTAIFGTATIGVKEAIGKDSIISPFTYQVLDDADEELVYQLAKWFHKNYDAYKDVYETAQMMSLDTFREFLNQTSVPVHRGTVRYLKEIGKWTAADDAWNEEARKLEKRYVDAWTVATAEARSKDIKIASGVKEWADLWAKYTADIPVFKSRVK